MAQTRCQETSNLLKSRQAALLKAKHQMEFDCQSYVDLNEVLTGPDDPSPLTWLLNSPLNNSGRRRSISSIGSRPRDPLSRCASLETDDESSSLYNESLTSQQTQQQQKPPLEARGSLGGIKEVRESAEDLLNCSNNANSNILSDQSSLEKQPASLSSSNQSRSSGHSSSSNSSCASSDRSGSISQSFMKRSNTWQYGMIPSKLQHDDNSELVIFYYQHYLSVK